MMRTTLTIDDDLDKRLRDVAHKERRPYKDVVNEMLRAGLAGRAKATSSAKRFRVQAEPRGFHPGIDLGKLNQVADELDVDDYLGKDKPEW